ncbi:MAG: hypothetical protein Hals2KO_13720 [Halioglobus sp.]
MSDEKSKVTDKASEIAKNIWLAGVGAYGKAVEDAQGRLEKAMEPPKLFKDLVKAGSALEEDAREALETTAAARQSVEERISRVRDNFHMQRPAKIEDLAELNSKVDRLSREVKALTQALRAQGIEVKSTRASGTAKKASGGKTAKTGKKVTARSTAAKRKPAKKAAAKKTATKKPVAKKKPAARRKSPASKRKA